MNKCNGQYRGKTKKKESTPMCNYLQNNGFQFWKKAGLINHLLVYFRPIILHLRSFTVLTNVILNVNNFISRLFDYLHFWAPLVFRKNDKIFFSI